MSKEDIFGLSGSGYLQDIKCKDNKLLAVIRMAIPSNSFKRDCVYLECEFKEWHKTRLFEWFVIMKNHHEVLLTFEVEYGKFVSGIKPFSSLDSSHTVVLHCKLLNIEACYVNGTLFFEDDEVA